MSSKGIRVFVYGTLKQGHCNNYLLKQEGVEFLGRCYIEGPFHMLNLHWFPGVIEHGKEKKRIYGEVYRVTQDTLDSLDILEGNGSFFTRYKVQTPWKNAWMYFLPSSYLENKDPIIEEGAWQPNEEELEHWRGTQDGE